MTLKERIISILQEKNRPMAIKEIAQEITDKPESTIRGRLNEGIGKLFKRVARGVYWFENDAAAALVVEGNGRDLSEIADETVDCLITDHPWGITKSHVGGNRKFTSDYDTFLYTLEDFKEKARVVKPGAFVVEFLPAENADNFEYLYKIKQYAKQCGLHYYAKVSWVKGKFVANTGRCAKNHEDIMIFSKGPARKLRPDKKKMLATGETHYMSGTAEMLPTHFNVAPPSKAERIHQAEKPIELYEQLLHLLTKEGEIILDQFAGSGNLGAAALKKNRCAILYESLRENIYKIKHRLSQYSDHVLELFEQKEETSTKVIVEPTLTQLTLF